MNTYLLLGLLLGFFSLPGVLLVDLVFRCPSCTAEDLYLCPNVTPGCMEVVREPGCGCCPVCARLEGEPCGVYTPRCATGLRCYPGVDADFPLQELLHGTGRCRQRLDLDVTTNGNWQPMYEGHETGISPTRRPLLDSRFWQELARKQHQTELKTKMKEDRVQKESQSACHQELDQVLEEISKMTSEDNRGPLEDLYGLKFPNCDRDGLYNLKQCNMSTHGQRGECWCVNPLTGHQLPETPRIRGDPHCNQFQEELRVMPTPTSR
ncbi:insulin-like growth factor-binding protein 2-A [Nematolebias whitei]|uniref:insulin-like growth factor-binding protein 2-A n=1 Tax=Nematolebias whitei TaxID=451745 RepID=UPI001897DD79|nr:insulin-like growth factor-binding protein 2-A [Nematolebias whitei]